MYYSNDLKMHTDAFHTVLNYSSSVVMSHYMKRQVGDRERLHRLRAEGISSSSSLLRAQFVIDITNCLFQLDATHVYQQEMELQKKYDEFIRRMSPILEKHPDMRGEDIRNKPRSWWIANARRYMSADKAEIWKHLDATVKRYEKYFPEMFIKRAFSRKIVKDKGDDDDEADRFTISRAKAEVTRGIVNRKGAVVIHKAGNAGSVTLDRAPYVENVAMKCTAVQAQRARTAVANELAIGDVVEFKGFQLDTTHQTTLSHLWDDRFSDPFGSDIYFVFGEDKNGVPRMGTPRSSTQLENFWRACIGLFVFATEQAFSDPTSLRASICRYPRENFHCGEHLCRGDPGVFN